MCCRYYLESSRESEELANQMNESPLVARWQKTAAVKTQGEIFPTDVVPVIAPDRQGRQAVFPMKWGFSGKSLLINARSETAGQKPTFREAWERHRCIIPASWYFEWEHLKAPGGKTKTGEKYMLQPKGSGMTWLCGLYRIEDHLPVFVVLTRDSSEDVRFLHDRMPLILPESLINEWIRPDGRPESLLPEAVTQIVVSKCTTEGRQRVSD